jgi:hypothetical protein
MTYGSVSCGVAVLKRLPEDLWDVTPDFGEFIQQEHAMVRERPLARPRHRSAADHLPSDMGGWGG